MNTFYSIFGAPNPYSKESIDNRKRWEAESAVKRYVNISEKYGINISDQESLVESIIKNPNLKVQIQDHSNFLETQSVQFSNAQKKINEYNRKVENYIKDFTELFKNERNANDIYTTLFGLLDNGTMINNLKDIASLSGVYSKTPSTVNKNDLIKNTKVTDTSFNKLYAELDYSIRQKNQSEKNIESYRDTTDVYRDKIVVSWKKNTKAIYDKQGNEVSVEQRKSFFESEKNAQQKALANLQSNGIFSSPIYKMRPIADQIVENNTLRTSYVSELESRLNNEYAESGQRIKTTSPNLFLYQDGQSFAGFEISNNKINIYSKPEDQEYFKVQSISVQDYIKEDFSKITEETYNLDEFKAFPAGDEIAKALIAPVLEEKSNAPIATETPKDTSFGGTPSYPTTPEVKSGNLAETSANALSNVSSSMTQWTNDNIVNVANNTSSVKDGPTFYRVGAKIFDATTNKYIDGDTWKKNYESKNAKEVAVPDDVKMIYRDGAKIFDAKTDKQILNKKELANYKGAIEVGRSLNYDYEAAMQKEVPVGTKEKGDNQEYFTPDAVKMFADYYKKIDDGKITAGQAYGKYLIDTGKSMTQDPKYSELAQRKFTKLKKDDNGHLIVGPGGKMEYEEFYMPVYTQEELKKMSQADKDAVIKQVRSKFTGTEQQWLNSEEFRAVNDVLKNSISSDEQYRLGEHSARLTATENKNIENAMNKAKSQVGANWEKMTTAEQMALIQNGMSDIKIYDSKGKEINFNISDDILLKYVEKENVNEPAEDTPGATGATGAAGTSGSTSSSSTPTVTSTPWQENAQIAKRPDFIKQEKYDKLGVQKNNKFIKPTSTRLRGIEG